MNCRVFVRTDLCLHLLQSQTVVPLVARTCVGKELHATRPCQRLENKKVVRGCCWCGSGSERIRGSGRGRAPNDNQTVIIIISAVEHGRRNPSILICMRWAISRGPESWEIGSCCTPADCVGAANCPVDCKLSGVPKPTPVHFECRTNHASNNQWPMHPSLVAKYFDTATNAKDSNRADNRVGVAQ